MIFIPCWSVRFWLLLWHFTALFTTPWAVWAWVSASQVGATEERLTVTGKIKMSDLRWRWRTKPCTVILVTRTTERITPVHVPGKQIGKSLLAEAKIWGFGLKFSAFDSTSGFKSFLKISAQNALPIKRKINRKKYYLQVRLQGCHFLTHCPYCPPVPHILLKPSQDVTALEHSPWEESQISVSWAHFQRVVVKNEFHSFLIIYKFN